MGEQAFVVEGRVIEALPNGTYRAELVNGHQLIAFLAGRDKTRFAGVVKAGETVILQLTPYDLSVGRILIETGNLKHESQSISQKNVRALPDYPPSGSDSRHLH